VRVHAHAQEEQTSDFTCDWSFDWDHTRDKSFDLDLLLDDALDLDRLVLDFVILFTGAGCRCEDPHR
jgi:hypothetical protein